MNEHDFDEDLRQVLVCTYGADCANATSKKYGNPTAIYDGIKAARNDAGLNRQLYVVRTSCQGWCQYAPICMVLPEGKVYQDIKPEESVAFVNAVVTADESHFSKRLVSFHQIL